MIKPRADTVVVGSGPNGLAAAIELARAGCAVTVYEMRGAAGGGTRSAALTEPGFVHDICSAVHPLAVASPFFRSLPLADLGLEWIQPPAPLAHPFENGTSVIVERDVEATARTLGSDGRVYRRLIGPLADQWTCLIDEVLAPIHFPQHLKLLARFAWDAARSAEALLKKFSGEPARALFAGMAGHSVLPLERRPAAAFCLLLSTLAHAVGWPVVKGGSQRIADALAAHLKHLGGRIVTGAEIRSINDLPTSNTVLFDVTPSQLLRLAGDRLPERYCQRLRRYRYGPGVFKMDWALQRPIPWKDPQCARAATLHVGGTFSQIAAAERAVARGDHPEQPFIILAQPSLFDSERAPEGRHTAWAYCHVPNGSREDMTCRIESQLERFAPGFRDCVMARHTLTAGQLETHNPNCIGGDITGGLQTLRQLIARPTLSSAPYRTPAPGIYICSASTPPGGGVHGMCGYYAARAALHDLGLRKD
ncbi:MAG TPA: NAD(P)/FAD-dependent oxidoreductase [Terriglobia bacterium]|nr:NAD(P)/FAD-dependent oxidoreductase [Terriglobia bacterium]